ncbi:MAG: HAMP domain-containing histidine kinase [Eubacterium sp.]|nr:HAMP domain-containing histidine kinase [Eubacterium sp.]
MFFSSDLFLFVTLSIGWFIIQETSVFKTFDFDRPRYLRITGHSITTLRYVVYENDVAKVNADAFTPLAYIASVVMLAILFQVLNLIFSSYNEYTRIKKTLRPLNELALKADEISRMTFDGSKYHKVEDAISRVSPEDMHTLSFEDDDLRGIEMAMNNLIVKMHDTYQQQSRFVDDASHELRTPIAVIQGYANMLDRWGKTDEDVLEESISAIKHESDHMNHLVEQLLFLARGDNGRNVMHFENISLNEMMKEIYEESLMIDESHPYRFSAGQNASGNIIVYADPSMLKQAVRILVDNAAKYTAAGDEISLSYGYDDNGKPYVQVQDSGIGMAESDVQHMFERFFRSDNTRDIKGTGLGLSIAKWIIDKHQGHFEILSREGLGTRIRIVLG